MNRWPVLLLSAMLWFAGANALRADSLAPTGKVLKVLPLYLDQTNHIAPSPSLFDRDAYQAWLREHTNEISGIRFDVMWKASHVIGTNLILRVELHGVGTNSYPTRKILEEPVTPKLFNHWATLTLSGPDYKHFGVLAAWRASLWNGSQLLGEQTSFLWSSP